MKLSKIPTLLFALTASPTALATNDRFVANPQTAEIYRNGTITPKPTAQR
ncbi:hypothetical protein [Actinobacillus capsulatus]|nr:hypothetical protein [Actinobacillus capsulatus]